MVTSSLVAVQSSAVMVQTNTFSPAAKPATVASKLLALSKVPAPLLTVQVPVASPASFPSKRMVLRQVVASGPALAVTRSSQGSVQVVTVKAAPATSKAAQISPPPCINKLFTSVPVVVPGTTMPRSKVLGSYTKV